jgi:TIR domain
MYDVFISYASPDRAWAQRLHQGLVGRGLTVFFDKNSLRDGEGWETQLNTGISQARHMVCLWSARAYDSAWVQNELGAFRSRLLAQPGQSKLLLLRLDERAGAFDSVQQIVEPALRAAYARPDQAIDEADWLAVVERVAQGLLVARAGLSIPLVLFTLTQAQADALGPADRAKLQARLGLDEAALATRYGTDQLAWRPFGGDSMGVLLNQAREELNKWLAPQTLDWELPGDTFWTQASSARDFARRMANCRLGAIVVDPVAMLVADVQGRMGFFNSCLQYENVTIIAMPTAPVPAHEDRLRNWLGEFAATLFDTYLEPPRAAEHLPSARYGVGPGDALELRRLMQRSVADFLRRALREGGATKNPITSFGTP